MPSTRNLSSRQQLRDLIERADFMKMIDRASRVESRWGFCYLSKTRIERNLASFECDDL